MGTQSWKMTADFRQLAPIERLLAHAERSIALLGRCQAQNDRSERERLLASVRAGHETEPSFSYAAVPDLSAVRHHLAQLAEQLSATEPLLRLYAARAQELSLEARLAEALGSKHFVSLASERFGIEDPAIAAAARSCAEQWSQLSSTDADEPSMSSDTSDPHSLVSRLSAELGRLRLPVRVELCADLCAAAATGDGVILVAPERPLGRRASARIALHEVYGHALPRERARQETLGLFATGSARGNDEQEGYALYLEEAQNQMDNARKRQLGLRHIAAVGVHSGQSWRDTVRELLRRDVTVEEAVAIACRVHRGGGLARESVYLPALLRVREAARTDPETLTWLGRGRLSLSAIRVLRSERAVSLAERRTHA
jgi:hypothetical protein